MKNDCDEVAFKVLSWVDEALVEKSEVEVASVKMARVEKRLVEVAEVEVARMVESWVMDEEALIAIPMVREPFGVMTLVSVVVAHFEVEPPELPEVMQVLLTEKQPPVMLIPWVEVVVDVVLMESPKP